MKGIIEVCDQGKAHMKTEDMILEDIFLVRDVTDYVMALHATSKNERYMKYVAENDSLPVKKK